LSNIDTSFVVYSANVAGELSRVCDDFVPKVQTNEILAATSAPG